jgi:hypothetical protein
MKQLFNLLLQTIIGILFSTCKNPPVIDCTKLTGKTWETKSIKVDAKSKDKLEGVDPTYIKSLMRSKIVYTFKPKEDILDSNRNVIGAYKINTDCNELIIVKFHWNFRDTFQIKELSNETLMISGNGLVYTFQITNK